MKGLSPPLEITSLSPAEAQMSLALPLSCAETSTWISLVPHPALTMLCSGLAVWSCHQALYAASLSPGGPNKERN